MLLFEIITTKIKINLFENWSSVNFFLFSPFLNRFFSLIIESKENFENDLQNTSTKSNLPLETIHEGHDVYDQSKLSSRNRKHKHKKKKQKYTSL